MSGKIIVFEGLDCSFKETNSKAYYEYLKAKGEKVALYSFPRYDSPASYFVKEYLAGNYGDTKDLDFRLVSTLYMIDMMDIVKKEIEPKLKEGYTIVLDRYWYSNIYFRIGIREMDKSRSSLCKAFTQTIISSSVGQIADMFGLPKADVVIKLKSDPSVMLDFVHKKNTKKDQHENNDELLLSVAEIFNNIDLSEFVNDKVVAVSTTYNSKVRSREDIFNDIVLEIGHE